MHQPRAVCLDRTVDVRAAAPRASLWTGAHGARKVLRVAFLNGSPELQERVEDEALAWALVCGLDLAFGARPEACEVRIEFGDDGASWSYIGATALTAPPSLPTMHFGWLDEETPDLELRTVVLHEFGHAYGLIHEHQSPAAGIRWNKQAIYDLYQGPPNYWNRKLVDANYFTQYEAELTNFGEFDPQSIMLYPIPPELTLDGFSVGWNQELSVHDKQFVARIYPR